MIHSLRSLSGTLVAIGMRAREIRVMRKLQQTELAARAGVGVATVIRFEKTGSATLANALRIATALHSEGAFEKLFEAPPYASLDEALERTEALQGKRAPRRRR